MYLPKELQSIDGTRLLGHWNDGQVPVYDVISMHGLNQIIGYIKHTNAEDGTVLYRGQAHLHEKLIPSILHGTPAKGELEKRTQFLNDTITKIMGDQRMNGTLHFDASTSQRYFYKQFVIESMLQHYGIRTRFQDFVDNHWSALWFGLYELLDEPMAGQDAGQNYLQYYYQRRAAQTGTPEKAPASMELVKPKPAGLPPAPKLEEIQKPKDVDIKQLKNVKSLGEVLKMSEGAEKNAAIQRIAALEMEARKRRNIVLLRKWEEKKASIQAKNKALDKQYEIDKESDTAYVYLLLYVADTRGDSFRGVYTGTETVTIDLRKALPSTLLRPCAQHGWTVRRNGNSADLSDGVVCVLRLTVELVEKLLGTGELVSQENFFPPQDRDVGYRNLLSREERAPFGTPPKKVPKDLPSLLPFASIQHFVYK